MSTAHPEDSSVFKSLNTAQRRAVTSNASTVAILAGPGSGKTHTLTSRIVWLIQKLNYQPADIIVATFTVKAAREMQQRIANALGQDHEKKIVLGTFHSIARRYLAAYGKHIGLDPKFGIADDGDSKAILQRICKRLNLNIEPSYARGWISKKKAKGTSAGRLMKNGKQASENPSLLVCYEAYQDQLARSNLLDYDDLLVRCVELLREYPSCVANVQAVLIDEYQDTNGIQYELMKLFAQVRHRITIVGDPDQSIYGWRSAEIQNLYRLLRDYPETDEVSLEENYRSSQSILSVSLNVIQQDKKRYQKVLLPVHTKGAVPVLRRLKDSFTEGAWIVSETKRITTMFGGMLKNADIAILLRSASLSRQIESALGKAGVPYRMIGGHKFYERKEIKVLLDYLRLVYQPDNNDALARVINVPRRGIGEATIKSLLEEAEQAKMSAWSLLWKHCRGGRQAKTNIRAKMEQKLNMELLRVIADLRQKLEGLQLGSQHMLVDLIEQLISNLEFNKYLEQEYPEDHEQRWSNVQEFISLANDFVRDFGQVEDSEALPEIEGLDQAKENDVLGRFLANVSLASDAQNNEQGHDKSSLVTISTIHAAKGLEWPVVFVPAVYTGSIPHSRSEDEDEERRLLYVAMTRAQTFLYLSCPIYGAQNMGKVELSPFIASFASEAFAEKGPSFDRALLQGTAKILQRTAPVENELFAKLPPMFSPEDDSYPVDPFSPDVVEDNHHFPRPAKRPRITTEDANWKPEEKPWQRDYTTTMEQSSGFTDSALPGFITAGAHRQALAATEANAPSNPAPKKSAIKTGTTRRPSDQKSLLAFFPGASNRKAPTQDEGRFSSYARYQSVLSRATCYGDTSDPAGLKEEKSSIDKSLAEHKPATGKILARPNVMKKDESHSKKAYACFSSSPTRPPAPESVDQMTARTASDRPASSFHTTTFVSAGGTGGVRRPRLNITATNSGLLKKPTSKMLSTTMTRLTGTPSVIAHVGLRTPLSTSPFPRFINTSASTTAIKPSWHWSNLSPATRRNIKVALGTGAAIDGYVVYTYFPNLVGKVSSMEQ
ncbi:ATP-dependent DNA helicase srs2 [Paramyrothecium foliicola]|nr:ATP-dependent DNA helicase srs2 [Paramyrothecium foliicola]